MEALLEAVLTFSSFAEVGVIVDVLGDRFADPMPKDDPKVVSLNSANTRSAKDSCKPAQLITMRFVINSPCAMAQQAAGKERTLRELPRHRCLQGRLREDVSEHGTTEEVVRRCEGRERGV